jgi:GTP-binding protein HflX
VIDPDDDLGAGFDEGELFELPPGEGDAPAGLLDGSGATEATHRGAFGEHGGASSAFIERTFRERIVLVGVATGGASLDEVESGLDELARLVDTAGADPVARVVQRRDNPDPATYIGKGKVEELRTVAEATDCDTVVFDEELSPAQQRNLEKLLGRTAIDRTAVILDIFAQNASSQEGKAQVDLALLRYRLPRLRGKGQGLSQQGGGIGTRQGGGETKLEVDRRRIVRRIHQLESELRDIGRHRATQRKARSRSRVQQVAIVGYTNAGKSTLLNRLTSAGVLVEDRLFATLDATTRRLQLPGGEAVLLTDTVGFVRKLPHGLVEAFKSTLDVVVEADLLIHVVDGSSLDPLAEIAAVRDVLAEIGADQVPELLCVNKIDLEPGGAAGANGDGSRARASRLLDAHPGAVGISARTGEGTDGLLLAIGDRLRALTNVVELLVPYERGDLLAAVHREGEVLSEAAGDAGMRLRARLDDAAVGRFHDIVVAPA